jgi:hypothetical protein
MKGFYIVFVTIGILIFGDKKSSYQPVNQSNTELIKKHSTRL